METKQIRPRIKYANANAQPSHARWRYAAASAVATAGLAVMATIVVANYAGWPDVVNHALTVIGVKTSDLATVSFWESIAYLLIISVVLVCLVRSILWAPRD